MPLSERELLARDAKRDIGKELLQSVRDIKSGRTGRRFTVASFPIIRARENTGLSQGEFAKLLGVSVRTLQDWEQGRRKPTGAARSLLWIAVKRPRVLQETFLFFSLIQLMGITTRLMLQLPAVGMRKIFFGMLIPAWAIQILKPIKYWEACMENLRLSRD